MFAGTRGGGVLRSADYGASWAQINEGLTAQLSSGVYLSVLSAGGTVAYRKMVYIR